MINPKFTSLQAGQGNDINPATTPIENPTFTLNVIKDSIDGDKRVVQSEPGNEFCVDPELQLVGEILGDNNEHFLFLKNDNISAIGILKDCEFTRIVESECLEFGPVITGEFRVRNGCERVVYFRDSVNKDRHFNFDRPELYKIEEEWDCNLFSLDVNTVPPCVERVEVINGGGLLELGNYYFILELLDSSKNILYRTLPTSPVPIWDESLYDDYDSIDGGLNNAQAEIGGVLRASKSIKLTIHNLNTSFNYVRVSVLRASTGTGVTVEAFRDELIQITGDTTNYIFNGTDDLEGIDPNEVLIPLVGYDSSRAMEQVQNRLVRANITEEYYDYSKFQRSASKVTSRFIVKQFDKKNQFSLGNPKNPNTWFESMNFMGDEIYNFNIHYLHRSGKISPGFHIPGQAKNLVDCEPLTQAGVLPLLGFNTCLIVRLSGVNYGLRVTHGSVTVKFKVNGENFTVTKNYSFQNTNQFTDQYDISKSYDVYCGQGTPTNITITISDDSGFGNINSSYIVNPFPVVGNVNLQAYTGWDDTVYPEFFPIMSHLIKDATIYQQMVESVGAVYGDYSVANLELLKETDLPRRWEIMNTAIKTSPVGGRMAYYECSQNYPEIKDCEGDSIWGEDACGNELEGTPMRFHRFPDRQLIPIESGDSINLLGVEFGNIEYPSDDIVGHFFSRAKRDDLNRTILDKGLACNLRENDKYRVFTFFRSDSADSKYSWLKTPRNLMGEALPGSYLKIENTYTVETTATKGDNFQGAAKGFEANDVHIAVRSLEPTSMGVVQDINYKILDNRRLEVYGRENVNSKKLINFSNSNRLNFLETDKPLPVGDNRSIAYVSVKDNRDVYCDIFNTEYFPMHHCYKTINDEQQFYAGDTFISNMHVSNHFLSDVDPKTGLLIFLAAIGIALSVAASLFTFGASLILTGIIVAGITLSGIQLGLIATMLEDIRDRRGEFTGFLDDNELSDAADLPNWDLDGAYIYYAELLNNFYVESEINYALRHGGSIEETRKFESVSGEPNDNIISYFNYIKDKILDLDDDGKLKLRSLILPEAYLYNRDYSRMLCDGPLFPLPLTYNYCSDCGGRFPNRIIFSPVSLENDLFDLYRINLANDFKDISAEKGEITGLEYKNNQLIVYTTRTTLLLRPNPQVLQTTEDTVHIGTGDFLSIPAVELIETDLGYGGLQSELAKTNSQFGTTWVDQNQGKILNWSSDFKELSLQDEQWFKENLPGGDVKCTYDPRYNRLIISRNLIENGENKSWTRSYSYSDEQWVSFHSYLPDFLFCDQDNFYTVKGTKIFKHLHNENFQTFYGKKYDCIVEYVSADLISEDFHTLSYYANTQKWDSPRKKFVNVYNITFDRLLVYNDEHTTGLLNLVFVDRNTDPYAGITYSPNNKTVLLKDNTYRVSQIRDISTGIPVMSSEWTDIQNDYFIDAVPINYDFNTDPYKLGFINGKWVKVRLFFKPQEDLRIIVHLINDNQYGTKY